jgi:hypothetical protein
MTGRCRGWIPLNKPEIEMIVKNKRELKTNRKGKSSRLLPPTGAGATPLRLVSGVAPAVAARHASGICADWEKRFEG